MFRSMRIPIALLIALLPSLAIAQQFPRVPAQTVIGRLGIPGDTGPSQAIPFANILPALVGTQSANRVYAGPSSGAVASPTFRALVGADLPVPGASSLGGVFSLAPVSHNFMTSIGTSGAPTQAQPSFADISGTATGAQLPNPAASTLGGVKSLAAVTHQYLTSISTGGQPTQAQPACTDLSDATSCNAARGQLPGETSTGSATAGNVGEYIESIVALGSAVSLVNNTPRNITSISLTAGDWDVSVLAIYTTAASTSVTILSASISTTTATLDTTVGRNNQQTMTATVPGAANIAWAVPLGPYRMSLSGTTTVFLVSGQAFTVSTMSAYGIIRARRVR